MISSVSKFGHLYQTLHERTCRVIFFPSLDIFGLCTKTVHNNAYDDDEIAKSGLTAEQAVAVDAPRFKECFLNIECEYLWEHEAILGSPNVAMCLLAKHISVDSRYYDENQLGRYGKTGFLYNFHSPRNPESGSVMPDTVGSLGYIGYQYGD